MTEPTTKAGRDAVRMRGLFGGETQERATAWVLLIEAQLRAEIAKGVEGLPSLTRVSTIPPEHHLVQRSAVLALIRGEEPAQDWTVEAADARIAAADASSPGPQEAE